MLKKSKNKTNDSPNFKLLIIVAIVAVAAIGAASYYYLANMSPTPTQPTRPGQNQTTPQQPQVPTKEYYYSLAECPKTAFIVVYANDVQKSTAKSMIGILEAAFGSEGANIKDVPKCIVSKDELGINLRVYPGFVYRGDVPGLDKYTVAEEDGYKILRPAISSALAYRFGIEAVYSYKAEALVVEGSTLFTKVRSDLEKLKGLFTQLAVADITEIKKVGRSDIPVSLNYVPTVVFVSKDPLDSGLTHLEKLGDRYYVPVEAIQKMLPDYLGSRGLETTKPPPEFFDKGASFGGDEAPIKLYLLEDYWCPFCAKLYQSTGDYLESLVKDGELQIRFVDLIVHPDVLEMHAFTDCLYEKTGDGYAYFNITREIYATLSQGKEPDLNFTIELASKYFSQDLIDEAKQCMESKKDQIIEITTKLQREEGLGGTPTLFFWNEEKKRGLIVIGYIELDDMKQIIEWIKG